MTRTMLELAPPSPNLHSPPVRVCVSYVIFSADQASSAAYLQWNRVSSLEPSGFEAETLPLGPRGLAADNFSRNLCVDSEIRYVVVNPYLGFDSEVD
ncbi:hypothetical protein AVEN_128191-1 [Araneus ventricosus]|uniref:Uncharacterized protein n=1 Tax=Araneus ventricosus TaxID=182803 RepID=A0A4Y2A152_ARAVE|nr:hypothetical protein AVEN_128191-1 [Araneus ventricosus]